MNPVMFLWMYYNWLKDIEEQNSFAKNYSVLIGSFTNPEMAKRMIKSENPDHISTNFEELSQQILDQNRKEDKIMPRKRRRVVRT